MRFGFLYDKSLQYQKLLKGGNLLFTIEVKRQMTDEQKWFPQYFMISC